MVPLVAVTAKTINLLSWATVGVNDSATWPVITVHPAGNWVVAAGTSAAHEYQAFANWSVGVASQVPRVPSIGLLTSAT